MTLPLYVYILAPRNDAELTDIYGIYMTYTAARCVLSSFGPEEQETYKISEWEVTE